MKNRTLLPVRMQMLYFFSSLNKTMHAHSNNDPNSNQFAYTTKYYYSSEFSNTGKIPSH